MIPEVLDWIVEQLRSVMGGDSNVHYGEGKVDAPYPQLVYFLPSGDPDGAMGSFETDDREYVLSVQAKARTPEEAIDIAYRCDRLLRYAEPAYEGGEWQNVGKVRWGGIVPDTGVRLPDRSLVYYAGNMYTLAVSRRRDDRED